MQLILITVLAVADLSSAPLRSHVRNNHVIGSHPQPTLWKHESLLLFSSQRLLNYSIYTQFCQGLQHTEYADDQNTSHTKEY